MPMVIGMKRCDEYFGIADHPRVNRATISSSYWKAYQAVIPDEQHRPSGSEKWEKLTMLSNGIISDASIQHASYLDPTFTCKRRLMHEIRFRFFLHPYNTGLLPSVG